MANINRMSGSEKENFKQLEGDNWSNIYLPAICAGVVMTIVLFMAVSCSKKSDNPAAKISAPVAPAVQSPAPATSAAAVPEAPKKAAKKHRPANATYVNGTYGVSFSYPRKYSLQAGDKKSEMPVESGFAKPGAVQVASVNMPDGGYPDTDFSSALLNVSVNPAMTAEECGQFAGKSDETAKAATDASTNSATEAGKPTTLKLGSNEFTAVEQMKGTDEKQSDTKYFHTFKNGACYEFALDVETSRKADEDLAQVDRGQVFKQLEKILTTAKIKEVELPGLEKSETASASTAASGTGTTSPAQPTMGPAAAPAVNAQSTEKAQVVTPEQK